MQSREGCDRGVGGPGDKLWFQVIPKPHLEMDESVQNKEHQQDKENHQKHYVRRKSQIKIGFQMNIKVKVVLKDLEKS